METVVSISILVLVAVIVDLIVGDPRAITHPVVYIGRLINLIEAKFQHERYGERVQIFLGGVLTVIVVGFVYMVTWVLVLVSYNISFILGTVISIWIIATTIAIKSLSQAGMELYYKLKDGELEAARKLLSMVVSRDTEKLSQEEVSRGAIETVAENTVDGVIAPIFYAFLGGPPLAMAYKAVNTLDSMVGYKNHKYKNFGMIAARVDDVVNYIPARICSVFMILAAFILRFDVRSSWRCMWQYAGKHPSPNGGIPESLAAGALNIRLGGYNSYHGQVSFRAYMGEALKQINEGHIKSTVDLMKLTSILFTITVALLIHILI
ncbi:adenosylcobinamide-phosphate synthase [Desulfitispora alkaliphila]|uniref:adenosylcobinamide-phosphate synthase CbiB n=1 Tax=Desulfitispora alkaliphila TaxID=622674 RepID=UPI003D1E270A